MTRFTLAPSERVLIVGRTGSGKTTLARVLVGGYRNLVVIDPKWRFELPRTLTLYSPADFRQVYPQRSTRIIFRPDPNALFDQVDEVLGRVLTFGRTAINVDEALDLATATRIVPAYRRLVKTGRELLCPVISCSQRPTGLHNDVIAEAEHLFAFDLHLATDRAKVAGIGGDGLLEQPGEPYAFFYYGPATGGQVVRCPPLALPDRTLASSPASASGGT